MNARRRKLATELVKWMEYSPRLAYVATKGIKGHRKPAAQSSIWQKLKVIKRIGIEEAKRKGFVDEKDLNT